MVHQESGTDATGALIRRRLMRPSFLRQNSSLGRRTNSSPTALACTAFGACMSDSPRRIKITRIAMVDAWPNPTKSVVLVDVDAHLEARRVRGRVGRKRRQATFDQPPQDFVRRLYNEAAAQASQDAARLTLPFIVQYWECLKRRDRARLLRPLVAAQFFPQEAARYFRAALMGSTIVSSLGAPCRAG